MRRWRRLLGPMLAVSLLIACSPQRAFSPRLTSDIPETPTPVSAATTSSPAGRADLSAEQGLAVVGQAYAILLQSYVDPVDPVALLRSAWDGFSAALPAGQRPADVPTFTGTNPQADAARFRLAYLAAASQVDGGQQSQAMLAYAAVRNMTKSLGDCHTAFSDPQQVREQTARLEGDVRFGGVGIRIKHKPDEPIVVWELLDGGSAAKSGIKPGDAILKVDGQDATPLPLDQIAALIRGPEGSQVKLTVQRSDGKKVQDFALKRVQISEPPFRGKWLAGNIGYFRLESFSQAGANDLLSTVREYEGKNPKGWILDLRTNGGGELPVLLSVLSKFLKEGPFGYQIDARGQRSAFGPDGSYLARQHPLVVLVSESTSSAAELFAAAIQQYHAGTVVGTKTAGCLGIGNRYQLPDGSGISVTVSKLIGPSGDDLNKIGVTPAEPVELTRLDLAAGKDPQLQRALSLLGAPAK